MLFAEELLRRRRAVRTASVEVVDVRQAGEFSSGESSSVVVELRQMAVSPFDA